MNVESPQNRFGARPSLCIMSLAAAIMLITSGASAQRARQTAPPASSASSSLLAGAATAPPTTAAKDAHALRSVSLFAVTAPEVRTFNKHDLIEIVVRESSLAKSSQELEAEKEYNLDGKIGAWPDIRLDELLQFQMRGGRTSSLPELKVDFKKEFDGDGEYERRDELTARLTAEVIEVLPNGHLVLEARTHIKTDEEEATMKLTGVCRPQDVSPANTILSNQIHDLKIDKMHKGELKKANEKGIIAKFLDFIFAF
jgi:flagellar L-ring protein precursor FlgH